MFAGSAQSIVCHIVVSNGRQTVCGLRVSKFASSRRSGGRLHGLTALPPDSRICKHCDRMSDQADIGGAAQIAKEIETVRIGDKVRPQGI